MFPLAGVVIIIAAIIFGIDQVLDWTQSSYVRGTLYGIAWCILSLGLFLWYIHH